jgi:uncharacterized metal-binding protein
LANQIAIELDRDQVAEMSCIAGVGGDIKGRVIDDLGKINYA